MWWNLDIFWKIMFCIFVISGKPEPPHQNTDFHPCTRPKWSQAETMRLVELLLAFIESIIGDRWFIIRLKWRIKAGGWLPIMRSAFVDLRKKRKKTKSLVKIICLQIWWSPILKKKENVYEEIVISEFHLLMFVWFQTLKIVTCWNFWDYNILKHSHIATEPYGHIAT